MSSAHQKRTGGGSNRCAYESTPIHGNPPSLFASALASRLGGELRQAGHVTAGPGETRHIRESDGNRFGRLSGGPNHGRRRREDDVTCMHTGSSASAGN